MKTTQTKPVAAVLRPNTSNSILVGRWRLDDRRLDDNDKRSITVKDSSGNGHDGQIGKLVPPPKATWTGHQPIWAASNDNVGACLELTNGFAVVKRPQVPANSWGLEPREITVEACFRAKTSPGTYVYLVSKGALQNQFASYAFYTGLDGSLYFYVCVANSPVVSAAAHAAKLWDSNWHVATGTFDGKSVRLFLDGVEVVDSKPDDHQVRQSQQGQSITYDLPTHNDLYIGAYKPDGVLESSGAFVGDIAEVRIWNKALLK
jgi:hypothetical protein